MEEEQDMNSDRRYQTNDVTYDFTATTFTKTSRLPWQDQRLDGTPFTWFRSCNHERITNEAKALELVFQQTTIPVPQLLDYGTYPDGRRYLVTRFIKGVLLSKFLDRGCSRPKGQQHTDNAPCDTCADQAYSNALHFIQGTVLPQLTNLTSQTRGIAGFVMYPSWLSPDVEPPWRGKVHWKTLPLETADYVFQHGDIAAHNLIMDPQTLQVKALIDWEHAGFFPPGLERWPGTLDAEAYRKRRDYQIDAIAEYFPREYLECYEGWSNKAELDTLIRLGKLPDPDRLRKARRKSR